MSLPERYFIHERADGSLAVKGQGNERASTVTNSRSEARREAHHLAHRADGTVEWVGTDGKFEKCRCDRCNANR
jgi:Uncharacterized protein conserved in bacteria (DUF2188)